MPTTENCSRVSSSSQLPEQVTTHSSEPGTRADRLPPEPMTSPAATAAPNAEGQDTAGEIVVTARRTEERLQRVPSSVSAFNERTLDRIQATDTTGLQGAVPNLNIVQGRGSSNATNIYIRGVGQPDAGLAPVAAAPVADLAARGGLGADRTGH